MGERGAHAEIAIFGLPQDGLMIGLDSNSSPGPSLVAAWKWSHEHARRFERLESAGEEAVLAARQEIESARRIAKLDADATLAELSSRRWWL